MDAKSTIARAVTIRNGRFVTVGDAAPAATPGARTIDLLGRTVVPGIIRCPQSLCESGKPSRVPHGHRERDVDRRNPKNTRGPAAERS